MEHDILILGTGSLARSLCHSLAISTDTGCGVAVASRRSESAAELCYVANARAAARGVGARFEPVTVDRYSAEETFASLGRTKARIVVNCASLQSPWESLHSPSAWTDLMERAGYGVTLPLQAAIAAEVSAGVAAADSSALFINACLPDAVNPLLQAMGLPIFCGVGNVATIAASVRASLQLTPERLLQVVAHHWHLHAHPHEKDEALAWVDGNPVLGVGQLLKLQRATTRSELNIVTGHVAALLLVDLVAGRDIQTNLPGPVGRLGGYPVRIVRGSELELDMPAESRDQALASNRKWAEYDGVVVEQDGEIAFGESATSEIASMIPEFGTGFRAADLSAVCSRLLELRSRMREVPAAYAREAAR